MSFIDIIQRELDNNTQRLNRFQQEIRKRSSYDNFSLDVKCEKNYDYYTVYFPNQDDHGRRHKRYVGRHEPELVRQIQTHYFLSQSIKKTESNIRLLHQVATGYKDLNINSPEKWPKAYRNLPAECFEIAGVPNFSVWEDRYKETHHIGKYRHPESLKQKTEDGGLVRSKSEAFIYNSLCREKLPFLYEMPWTFDGNSVNPDFTILSRKSVQMIIWEHLGLLTSQEYVRQTQWKLHLYLKAGFILGDNLILTADSPENGIDTSEIQKIIQEYLL
ncbi:MAG: hypothetical protein LKE86_01180 [Eubacterium sp.]|jgi:hypothetical protein|nr:hypothetical protein [Eubacterium sp.]MCH4046062.1 hypothetical protein [Eubacterium sp.]MCH4079157.1 hypothetical protein [Eubacterium sp.]MCH4110381.1 hypothetical protein [Eubacterium sp.]MCI1475470.1 hypothetical protein [Eubacterium sp.]